MVPARLTIQPVICVLVAIVVSAGVPDSDVTAQRHVCRCLFLHVLVRIVLGIPRAKNTIRGFLR